MRPNKTRIVGAPEARRRAVQKCPLHGLLGVHCNSMKQLDHLGRCHEETLEDSTAEVGCMLKSQLHAVSYRA